MFNKCAWCGKSIAHRRKTIATRFCSKKCRQSAFRCRRQTEVTAANDAPLLMAYADPPYPGMSRLYSQEPDYDDEINHKLLIKKLQRYDGWALSTSAKTLQPVLSLCPKGVRVGSWVKPIGVSSRTHGMHNTWEPLIVVPGRSLRPGFRDWLSAQPARHGGELIGRKPLAFCTFLFRCLGLLPGDTLDDLFPGTGIVGRAWRELSQSSRGDGSARYRGDASPLQRGDTSAGDDASPVDD